MASEYDDKKAGKPDPNSRPAAEANMADDGREWKFQRSDKIEDNDSANDKFRKLVIQGHDLLQKMENHRRDLSSIKADVRSYIEKVERWPNPWDWDE